MTAIETTRPAPAGARTELLLLAGSLLVGAVAGVLYQAGVELTRYERGTRAQLRAAGELLDQLEERWRAEHHGAHQWRELADHRGAEANQLREQRDECRRRSELAQLDAAKQVADLQGRLDVIGRAVDASVDGSVPERLMHVLARELRQADTAPVVNAERMPSPPEVILPQPWLPRPWGQGDPGPEHDGGDVDGRGEN